MGESAQDNFNAYFDFVQERHIKRSFSPPLNFRKMPPSVVLLILQLVQVRTVCCFSLFVQFVLESFFCIADVLF